MVLLVSSMILILYTIILYVLSMNMKATSPKASKCVPMAYGMVSSTMIGLIITFLFPNALAATTIAAILVSFVFAGLLGTLFGFSAAIDSLSSSFMGAMMGAMLAAMIPAAHVNFLLISMDVFFVLFIAILLFYLKQQSKQAIILNIKKVALGGGILLSATFFSLVASAFLDTTKDANPTTEQHQHH